MFFRIFVSLSLASLASLAIPAQASSGSATANTARATAAPIHQLRIYELNPTKTAVFHARFSRPCYAYHEAAWVQDRRDVGNLFGRRA